MNTHANEPWWASDGPVDGTVDRDEDPLDAHRRARASGERSDDGADPGWHDVVTGAATAIGRLADAMTEFADGATDGGDDHDHVTACRVCPVCAAVRTVADSRPELLGHLAEASRHLAAAVRTLAESPDTAAGADDGPLERIDLDRSPGRG